MILIIRLFSVLCVFLTTSVFAQQFRYSFQLNNSVTDVIKPARERMYQIFDVMPAYNDSTNKFSVSSDTDVDQEKLSQKIAEFGFIVVTFKKERIIITPQDVKVD